ncbi:PD-(D/E)XK nuclease superfamily protein [Halanaerobium saccharolyticum]|uniref:PD-(D/E)XK nuclease superfamily protein n=1 Tax=Halanaerobium saccharolyticum TaxID=43595 RepID=A0A4R6LLT3_9FIRM|nr:PD-(D/E)XK nuclease family protein [Halanaerobium saccharolyticum]TDO86144.1 PD-(D/E)XK nuclease superfamily protein [Halanaerobium saccharolyticum]
MAVNNLKDLYFSQSALSIFNDCRRRFRYRYLDGLYWPAEWGMNEEVKNDLKQGSQFHLLAERYYSQTLGETVLSSNQLLQSWLNRLKTFCPADNVVSAEQELRFQENNLKLLAKYDLLKYDQEQSKFIIFDWKTDKKSLYEKDIENSMQSRFYLYLLYEAGYDYFAADYKLQQMPGLSYWNPRYPDQSIQINYTQDKFNQDRNYFKKLITEILTEEEFPLTDDLNKCRFCEYRPICRGKKTESKEIIEEDLDLNLDWEAVEEIEF